MNYPFIQRKRTQPVSDEHLTLPRFQREDETHPEDYDADDQLVDAVNVALLMGHPLLLTGEPGSGKTRLAFRIAWELGLEPVLTYSTKSTSTAKDLFYSYDYLARFHAAHLPDPVEPKQFIRYHALGEAIIRTNPVNQVAHLLPPGFVHDSPKRSVVLIDEIDKAPRDFPNDILNEIENLCFRIPELSGHQEITINQDVAPLIFITSNAEKILPKAFLRRCAYYHIEFPSTDRLIDIVTKKMKRIPSYLGRSHEPDHQFIANAVELFFEIRHALPDDDLRPSTAELIMWVAAMRDLSQTSNPIIQDSQAVNKAMTVLIKSKTANQTALQLYGNGSWKPKAK